MKKKQKKVVFDFLNSEKPIIKKYLSSVHRTAANGKKKKKKKKKKKQKINKKKKKKKKKKPQSFETIRFCIRYVWYKSKKIELFQNKSKMGKAESQKQQH